MTFAILELSVVFKHYYDYLEQTTFTSLSQNETRGMTLFCNIHFPEHNIFWFYTTSKKEAEENLDGISVNRFMIKVCMLNRYIISE